MEHRIIDLHVHSTESDGTLTPTEIVSAAKAAGLSAFALTDHDTAAGVSKAAPAAAACGIELIPGIELSTEYELPTRAGGGKEVHIVGLYIDPEHPLLIEKTNEFRRCRDARNEKIVAALAARRLFHYHGSTPCCQSPTVSSRAQISHVFSRQPSD